MKKTRRIPIEEMSTSNTVAEEAKPQAMRHIAICAFPFGTHPATLLQLTRRLAASIPTEEEVAFTFFSTASSNAELFGSAVPEKISPRTVEIPEGEANEVDRFLEGGAEALRKSIAEAEAEVGAEIGCVVSDAFLWFCRAIAEEKGAPWVPFWNAGPTSLSAHVSTDLFRTKFGLEGIEGKEKESADLIPGFTNVLAEDLPQGVVSGDLASPVCQMLHNVGLNVPKSIVVCVNSFQELDPTINQELKSKLPDILNVGPFSLTSPQENATDEHGCIAFLDQHKDNPSSVVYISFGTITTPSHDEIKALAEALEAKGAPFLWSLKKECQNGLPEGFLDKINVEGSLSKVVPWTPQLQVLGHPSVGVFVTHCGWNSVLESIVYGVPMVAMPFFHDQMLTSKFIDSVWKIGVQVEGNKYNKEGIEKALQMVMGDEEKTLRESVQALKEKASESNKTPEGSSIKDIEKLVEIVMGSPKKEKKETKHITHAKSWKKWFKVFRVWKR